MTWRPFETYITDMFTPQCDHQKLQLYYTHHRHEWASDDQKNASSLRLHDHDMLFGRTSLNIFFNRYRSRSTCRNRLLLSADQIPRKCNEGWLHAPLAAAHSLESGTPIIRLLTINHACPNELVQWPRLLWNRTIAAS